MNISIILPDNTQIDGKIYHGVNNRKIKLDNDYYQIKVSGGEQKRVKLINQITGYQELRFTVNLKNKAVKIEKANKKGENIL
ncbi:MAG: hypothetical protein JRJ44_09095 [Deltaproteobacteria bacterium]|nr:hypothetical protein [Deltaproteobacteria bacterium]